MASKKLTQLMRRNDQVAVDYHGGGYVAYVSEDDEEGGYAISYHTAHEVMPAIATDHAGTLGEVETKLHAVNADMRTLRAINPEE
jgi:hypothetical protein